MSDPSIDNDSDNYFHVHYKVLNIFGIAIKEFQHPIGRRLYQAYAVTVITLFFYLYSITETLDLLKNWKDWGTSTFTLCYLLSHILGICKLSLVLIFKKNIHGYCQLIKSGIFLPDVNRSGAKEFEFVSNATKASNKQAYFFHTFVVLIVGQRALYAMFDPGHDEEIFDVGRNLTVLRHVRSLPYSCWLPFEPVESPYYEIAAFYQVLSACFFGFIIGACDALISGILCHIKAQILILKNCLGTFLERAAFLMKKDGLILNIDEFRNGRSVIEKLPCYIQKYVDICIVDCVKHHQKIIDLAEGAEDTFRYLMLVQFLFSLLLMCFQLFQLSLYELGSLRFFSMVSYLFLMMFQILIFCWHGNEIILESGNLMNTVFNSNWMVISTSTQKTLLLMMIRSYRPIKMTAGKFTFLSLETFMAIVRGSGSYFMVLRKMNLGRV